MYEEPLKRKKNTLVCHSRFGEKNNYFRHKPNPYQLFKGRVSFGKRTAHLVQALYDVTIL